MKIVPIEKKVSITGWFEKSGIWDISADNKVIHINNIDKKKQAELIPNERIRNCDFSASVVLENLDKVSYINAGLIFLKQDEYHYFWLGLMGQNSKLVLAKVFLDGNTIRTNPIKTVGEAEDIVPDKKYNLRIRVENNGNLKAYLNGGLALEANLYANLGNEVLMRGLSSNHGKVGLLVGHNVKASFHDVTVNSLKWPPFVLTPSDKHDSTDHHYDILYESIINRACTEVGFGGAYREIDQHNSGSIMEDIINNIDQSEIVIIVLTGLNPNVCFELGYSFAMKKKIILMAEKSQSQSIPFNFKDLRCLFYSLDEKSMAIEKLKSMLIAEMSQSGEIDKVRLV